MRDAVRGERAGGAGLVARRLCGDSAALLLCRLRGALPSGLTSASSAESSLRVEDRSRVAAKPQALGRALLVGFRYRHEAAA